MPVVRTDNGRRAGRVTRACVDDGLTTLCGVWVANGWRRARYCPAERIRLIGDVSVLIDGELLRVRQSAACGHPLALRCTNCTGNGTTFVINHTTTCVTN